MMAWSLARRLDMGDFLVGGDVAGGAPADAAKAGGAGHGGVARARAHAQAEAVVPAAPPAAGDEHDLVGEPLEMPKLKALHPGQRTLSS